MCRICDISEAAAGPETSRRRFLQFAGGIAAGLALAPLAHAPATFAKDTKPPPKPQNQMSPAATN